MHHLHEEILRIGIGDAAEHIVYEEVTLQDVGRKVLRVAAGLVVLVPMLDLGEISEQKIVRLDQYRFWVKL